MDFRITLDITERFADALNALVRIVQNISIQAARTAISEQPAQTAPEPAAEAEPVVIPPEPEASPTETVQPQETAIAETPANDDAPIAEPAPEKPKKKKASKKPVEAPEPASEPEAPVIQPAPEPTATAPTAPQEPVKSDGDPMAGMTVVEAMQALVSEIQQKGVDMAAVNGRVRAKASELGLAYSSAACLIKAIGYVETRKVALGEK